MAEEISFKLVAIPPEDLTKDEFKSYVSSAAPHALFEEPSMLTDQNLENTAFRRHFSDRIMRSLQYFCRKSQIMTT